MPSSPVARHVKPPPRESRGIVLYLEPGSFEGLLHLCHGKEPELVGFREMNHTLLRALPAQQVLVSSYHREEESVNPCTGISLPVTGTISLKDNL